MDSGKGWPLALEVCTEEYSLGPSSDRISQLTNKLILGPSRKERLHAEGVATDGAAGAGASASADADADAGCEKSDGRPLAITSDWNPAR